MVVGSGVRADEAISFTFYDFPPKMIVKNGVLSGARYEEMNRIGTEAGLAINWIRTSMAEEGEMLNKGQRAFCATGRAYTAERSRRWVFIPYELDRLPRRIFLARKDVADRLLGYATVEEVIENSDLRGAMLSNFIYTDTINTLLQDNPDRIMLRANDIFQVIDMVRVGRADFTVVPHHNWEAFKADREDVSSMQAMPDIRVSGARRLFVVCSHAVPQDVRQALAGAMGRLGYRETTVGK